MAKEKFDFIQPIKDIPKTLKGFPKNLVHIWKDPVNNSEEIAARKKEIFPYIYLFAGLFLVLVILNVVFPKAQNVLMTISLIPGFGIIGGVFLLNVMKKAQEKFSDLECPNCKTRIAYNSDVRVKVINRQFTVTKEKQVMSGYDPVTKDTPVVVLERTPMYVKIVGKERTTAEITCNCQNCGAEKTFTHEFVTAECSKFENKIMAIRVDEVLAQYEQDVRDEGAEGFDGKHGITDRGVEIKYNRGLATLVAGYFGNEIQMR